MAFILESTEDGAGTIRRENILMTNSEAGVYGEAVTAASGRWTKCAATAVPTAVLKKATSAGTDVETEYINTRRDQVWLADITGAAGASAVAAVVGNKVIRINSAGTGIDSDQLTGGRVEIVSVDTVANKARVKFDL